MTWIVITLVGLVAGTLGGVVGFGGTVILLPVLTFFFGAKQAVPIMAVAALLGNAGRIWVWWREIDWRAVGAFAVTAVPGAALGAHTLVMLDERMVEVGLGVFLIAVVPLRAVLARRGWRIGLKGLAAAGAVLGFLTGLVASTGPVNAPLFLAYGLTRGAYVGTEAASSLAMYITKAGVFEALGALSPVVILRGLVVGATLVLGAMFAKRLVLRLAPGQFSLLMDVLLIASGAAILWRAFAFDGIS